MKERILSSSAFEMTDTSCGLAASAFCLNARDASAVTRPARTQVAPSALSGMESHLQPPRDASYLPAIAPLRLEAAYECADRVVYNESS